MLVKASAPGSLMLLGEYAVLEGRQALVCAVNKRISVTLTPRTDKKILIHSHLGQLEISLSQLCITKPFQFVTAILEKFRQQIQLGCELKIDSEISEQQGLGSSAAVTVAVLAALATWLNLSFTDEQLIQEAKQIIRLVQGMGSGADAAACVLGGVVAYQTEKVFAEKIADSYPITAVYSGYKTSTVEAIQKVKTFFRDSPEIFQRLSQEIASCAAQGIQTVRDQDWQALGRIMNTQQNLMESLGVNTPELAEIIDVLRADHQIIGAKISGSGLGDCIIGLGHASAVKFSDEKIKILPIQMSAQGVICEKN